MRFPTSDPALGPATQLLRDFDVQDRIGEGGSAVVYRAVNRTFQGAVALKVWRGTLTVMQRRRFLQECHLQWKLSDHPNIVRLYWADAPEGESAWLASELYEESLAGRLAGGVPVSVDQAFAWADDVLAGLAAVHAESMLHRDVKPANVLLKAGRAALTDLGIAMHLEGWTRDVAAGTDAFVAPELLRGAPPSGRSDVYSAAVTIRRLFGAVVPGPVEGVLTRASSAAPGDRPQDAAQFREALAQARQAVVQEGAASVVPTVAAAGVPAPTPAPDAAAESSAPPTGSTPSVVVPDDDALLRAVTTERVVTPSSPAEADSDPSPDPSPESAPPLPTSGASAAPSSESPSGRPVSGLPVSGLPVSELPSPVRPVAPPTPRASEPSTRPGGPASPGSGHGRRIGVAAAVLVAALVAVAVWQLQPDDGTQTVQPTLTVPTFIADPSGPPSLSASAGAASGEASAQSTSGSTGAPTGDSRTGAGQPGGGGTPGASTSRGGGATTAAPPTQAPPPPAGQVREDFTGNTLPSTWGTPYEGPKGNGAVWAPSQVRVSGGELQILGQGTNPSGSGNRSGGICWECADGQSARTYGTWQARARFDKGAGYRQELGLGDGSNYLTVAQVGSANKTSNTMSLISADGSSASKTVSGDFSTWHTYTIDWRPDHVRMLLDGSVVFDSRTNAPSVTVPSSKLYFFAQQQLGPGGGTPGPNSSTPNPVIMHVDWVTYTP